MSNKYIDVIIAGFGGQGVMLIGNLLAYSGMESGLNVTYMPEYGPEMRGGTANCTVVVASEEIGSPIIKTPKSLIIMNQPSLDKFLPRIEQGGLAVVNSSLVDCSGADVRNARIVQVPANEIADQLGNAKMANMVALGAYIESTGALSMEVVSRALKNVIAPHYAHLIPKNAAALEAGAEYVRKNMQV
ncbi:MAG: 2-oxoacid:acceptor oxidoreductase family protein [Desulfovibrionaceae bacterium]|nr:2-oxoacid:acceptor oxidoreductase family protein [Desulfovibrionaceae bacterium]